MSNLCIFGQEAHSILVDHCASGAFSRKWHVFQQTFCQRRLCFHAHPRTMLHFLNFLSMLSHVFMNIPGGWFISNISMGQRSFSDPEEHIHEPPQLAESGAFHSCLNFT